MKCAEQLITVDWVKILRNLHSLAMSCLFRVSHASLKQLLENHLAYIQSIKIQMSREFFSSVSNYLYLSAEFRFTLVIYHPAQPTYTAAGHKLGMEAVHKVEIKWNILTMTYR